MRTIPIAAIVILSLAAMTAGALADTKTAQSPVSKKQVTITKTTPKLKVNGYTYYFADKSEKDKFEKSPEKYMKYIVCPVTEEKVKLEPGQPRVTYKKDLYLFCCKQCVARFNKSPEPYVKRAPVVSAQLYGNYYCTMHPAVVSKTKGKCDICGMNLVPVPKKADKDEGHNH
jgi:YHS domain-containing protein